MAVTGIDLSERFAQQALELNQLTVQVGDFLDMGGTQERFDPILMLATISNMRDLPRQLEMVAHLLKPDGLFFFNFPCASFPHRPPLRHPLLDVHPQQQ